jgi:hypothetical protein
MLVFGAKLRTLKPSDNIKNKIVTMRVIIPKIIRCL